MRSANTPECGTLPQSIRLRLFGSFTHCFSSCQNKNARILGLPHFLVYPELIMIAYAICYSGSRMVFSGRITWPAWLKACGAIAHNGGP